MRHPKGANMEELPIIHPQENCIKNSGGDLIAHFFFTLSGLQSSLNWGLIISRFSCYSPLMGKKEFLISYHNPHHSAAAVDDRGHLSDHGRSGRIVWFW